MKNMKKLLGVLAVAGLTAGGAVGAGVAGSKLKTNSDANAFVGYDGIVNFKSNQVRLDQSFAMSNDATDEYGVFDENYKILPDDANVTITPTDDSLNTNNNKAQFDVKFKMPNWDRINKNKAHIFYFAKVNADGTMGQKIQVIKTAYNKDYVPEAPKAKVATQSFMATSVDATFTKEPTTDELKQDFMVKDENGKEIKGVQYSFIKSNDNNTKAYVSFASGITGKVSIKIPAKKNEVPKPITVAANPKAKGLSGFTPKKVQPKIFIEDAVTVAIADMTNNGKTLPVSAIVKAMSKDTVKRVTEGLKLSNINQINNFIAKKGMTIDRESVTSNGKDSNGNLINNSSVLPDGSKYQVGLTSDGQSYYWIDLAYDKLVADAPVQISNYSVNNDANLIVADLANAGQYANKDLNQLGLIKLSINDGEFSASNIKSAVVNEVGHLEVSLKNAIKSGDAVKIQITNKNNPASATTDVVIGTPIVTNVFVQNPKVILAKVAANEGSFHGKQSIDLKANKQLKFYCGQHGLLKDDEIQSAILEKDGNLTITLNNFEVETGCTVKVAIANDSDSWSAADSKDAEAIFGNPSITDLHVATGHAVMGTIDDMMISGGQLIKNTNVKAEINGVDATEQISSAAIANKLIAVNFNKDFEQNDKIIVSVKDANGNWWTSTAATYADDENVSDVKFTATDAITATLNGMSFYDGQDLIAKGYAEVFLNGQVMDNSSISGSEVDGNILKMDFNKDFEVGDTIQISILDTKGKWCTSETIKYTDDSSISNLHVATNYSIMANLHGMDSLNGQDLKGTKKVQVSIDGEFLDDNQINSILVAGNTMAVNLKFDLKQGQVIQISIKDDQNIWITSEAITYNDKSAVSGIQFTARDAIIAKLDNMNSYNGRDLVSDNLIEIIKNGQVMDNSLIAGSEVDEDVLKMDFNDSFKLNDTIKILVLDESGKWCASQTITFNDEASINNLHAATNHSLMADIQGMDSFNNKDLKGNKRIQVMLNGETLDDNQINSILVAGNTMAVNLNFDLKLGDQIEIAAKDDQGIWTESAMMTFNDDSSVTNLKAVDATTLTADLNDMYFANGSDLAASRIETFIDGQVSIDAVKSAIVENDKVTITLKEALKDKQSIQISVRDQADKWSTSEKITYVAPLLQNVHISDVEGNQVIEAKIGNYNPSLWKNFSKANVKVIAQEFTTGKHHSTQLKEQDIKSVSIDRNGNVRITLRTKMWHYNYVNVSLTDDKGNTITSNNWMH